MKSDAYILSIWAEGYNMQMRIFVQWSDGSLETYPAVSLGCAWLRMSNDEFLKEFGFNFNPHLYPPLYELCCKILYDYSDNKEN